jgi:fructose-1,6-bisphosphatase I / sedoheptulose-1,7-bisphosphatase
MLNQPITLTQYLIEQRRRFPQASGQFNSVILAIALACKALSRKVAYGALAEELHGHASAVDTLAETDQRLDQLANDTFLHCLQWGDSVRGLLSEQMTDPLVPEASGSPVGDYLLAFDPLDGSSNIDVNLSVGSIFSVLRASEGSQQTGLGDFLQPGFRQVAAGYALYGPSTMFVLTVGHGTHGFTLNPELGEFLLTHPDLKVPEETQEFAINASNSRFWEPPIRRYVEECLAGRNGPRQKDFNMRWIASMVADAHRILTRGGVFMYPRDTKEPTKAGRLCLLYACNPIGMLIEQAGGRASSGEAPILQIVPCEAHQRIGFVFGSRKEVERIERYHREKPEELEPDTPLFNRRGLFRSVV